MTRDVSDKFAQKVQKARAELEAKRRTNQFPPITPEQHLRLGLTLTAAQYRLVRRLMDSNGVRTDELTRNCAICNISDTARKANFELERMGLRLACQVIPDVNRYGHMTQIGVWWLSVVDAGKWSEQGAAA